MKKLKAQESSNQSEKTVNIPPINLSTVEITLEGISPLVVHKFSEKAKKEMADKGAKVAKNARPARDPEAEYLASLYTMPGKKDEYGIPASGVKLTAVSACRFVDGMPMSRAHGSFHVLADSGGLIKIIGKPTMYEAPVRVGGFGNRVAMMRYRGLFDPWSIKFRVTYNQDVISSAQLLNLYENAGFSVGLCEHRPEKKGSFGMFRVKRK